ncbi:MAG: HAD family hydrolase [Candidatus Levyibacteriota bacterium]
MTILFDIDYTLFDTETFKKSNLTSYNLYPQTKKVLEQLKSSFRLGILSEGETDFQMKKLQETGILGLFDRAHIFIITNKIESLPGIMEHLKEEEVVFVEDKIRMLEKAKSLDPQLKTVWFKNGPFVEESGFTPDHVIESLADLLRVLE